MALGDGATDDMTPAEARLRLWAFHVYFDEAFATEPNHALRFAKAIIASAQPIRPGRDDDFPARLRQAMKEKREWLRRHRYERNPKLRKERRDGCEP
jgi:hypothetical protein